MNKNIFEQQQQVTTYSLAEKLNSQSVVSFNSESSKNTFGMCTNSQRKQNEVHIIEYDDQINKITRNYITFHKGILEKIIADDHEHFFIAFKENFGDKHSYGLSYNKMALDKYSLNKQETQPIWSIKSEQEIKSVIKLEGNKYYIATTHNVYSYDFSGPLVLSECPIVYRSSTNIGKVVIDPHHQHLLAIVNDSSVHFLDTRTNKVSYEISDGHFNNILDLDFNPNKQYQVVTNGEDIRAKIWEMRRPTCPVKCLETGNLILSSSFNPYHDQLILFSADDGSLSLFRNASTSSAPLLKNSGPSAPDGLVKVFDEHDDSVHQAAWSVNSAWIFASVSFSGNLIINSVPTTEKYSILL